MESGQVNEEYILEELNDLSTLFRRVDSINLSLDDFDNELDSFHIDEATVRAAIGSVRSIRNLLSMINDLARREANKAQQKYQDLVDQRKNPEWPEWSDIDD